MWQPAPAADIEEGFLKAEQRRERRVKRQERCRVMPCRGAEFYGLLTDIVCLVAAAA